MAAFFAEREPWRKEAEARCIGSGAVREGPASRARVDRGPGVCGTDYPFKVSALSQPTLLGYGEELRPPGSHPQRCTTDATLAGNGAVVGADL